MNTADEGHLLGAAPWLLKSAMPKAIKVQSAEALLTAAANHMAERAVTYDQPGGERSIARTVEAFNAITGKTISESDGWLFMQILKDVRDRSRKDAHRDSLEDSIAYAALKAEARLGGR